MAAAAIIGRSTSTFACTILRLAPPTSVSTPRRPCQVSFSNGFVPSNFSLRCPPRVSPAPFPIRLVRRELSTLVPVHSAISATCLISRLPTDANSSIQGVAEEATAVFSETAALCIQKHYLQNGLATQNLHLFSKDRNLLFSSSVGFEDFTPRQLKHIQANNLRDIPGNYHAAAVSAVPASQPLNGGPSNTLFYNTPSPMATQCICSSLC